MTTIDLLKFVKAQLIHMEDLLQDIDQSTSNGAETIHKYPIHSNTGALFLIDLAIQFILLIVLVVYLVTK